MPSLLYSSPPSAMRKQVSAIPLRVNSAQSVASVQTCSSFSTLCPQARLKASRTTRAKPNPRILYCLVTNKERKKMTKKHASMLYRPQFSLPTLPTRQSRTFLAQLGRQAQALKQQSNTPSAAPSPATSDKKSSPTLQLTNLPYFVRRTASNQLPVYVVTKAGGTKQLTKLQKTEGDLVALRNDLASALGVVDGNKPNPDVSLNQLTGHIIVKGWRKPEILNFLNERKF
ncbi:Ribosomal protein L49/IMG2 [Penicillium roqueforti FM164]|uniref:Large ribosomal subunit protein mL49 n=1 Tax=Penicillium roqueforti (strain FM164) TaxID=1365484 RepID=W6Q8L0_PENRF|nr:Ribosomal protein L49/IMG2 [Penicillium roqueforti FM164]